MKGNGEASGVCPRCGAVTIFGSTDERPDVIVTWCPDCDYSVEEVFADHAA